MLQWFPIGPISQVEMCNVRTFLRFGLPSTRKRVLKAPKKPQVSKTASRVYCPEWRFWKTPAFCLRVDGRKIVTIIYNIINTVLLAFRMLDKACYRDVIRSLYFHRVSVFT